MFPQVNPGSDACQVARGRLDFLFFIFLFFFIFFWVFGKEENIYDKMIT